MSKKILVFFIPIPGYAGGYTSTQKFSYEPTVEILSRCVRDIHLGQIDLSTLEDDPVCISSIMVYHSGTLKLRHV